MFVPPCSQLGKEPLWSRCPIVTTTFTTTSSSPTTTTTKASSFTNRRSHLQSSSSSSSDDSPSRDDDTDDTDSSISSSLSPSNTTIIPLQAQPQLRQQQQLSPPPPQRQRQPYRPLGPKFTATPMRQLDDTLFRNIVSYLAELSLQDYQWRTSLFQQNEADRMMEESMARIRFGDDEIHSHINYIRPMDAPTLGPLGKLEKYYVTLLYDVFLEEQRRAQRIIAASGKLIRPSKNTVVTEGGRTNSMMTTETDTTATTSSSIGTGGTGVGATNDPTNTNDNTATLLGPLGRFEARVVEFWNSIQQEEMSRVRTKTWRPKDLPQRGPLGRLELLTSTILEEVRASELIRAQQAKIRNDGTIVRPIDIPGPLGEIELHVSDIIQEEFRRVREKRRIQKRSTNDADADADDSGSSSTTATTTDPSPFVVLRPKDATNPGPLGVAEATAYAAIQSVSQEEMERLKAIQRTLDEYRPMNHPPVDPLSSSSSLSKRTPSSVLYTLETIVVGIVRAPQLLWSVLLRVQELLSSTPLDRTDLQLLQQQQQQPPPPPDQSFTTSTNSLPPSSTPATNDDRHDNDPPPPLGEFL